MHTIFGKDSPLKNIFENYEHREEQLLMADFIVEQLYERENGLVEAGTGTGKTLAYLAPLIAYALEEEKKVVISTETRALQKQLMDKDLPLVERIFSEHQGKKFSYALCLGSANYPCRKRFEKIIQTGTFHKSETSLVESMAASFKDKKIFTRLDTPGPSYLWDDLCREADTCTSYRCAFASQCLYLRARKQWNESSILVMNHYLFFSNIGSGSTYLPQCEIALFDEAHSLEDIASSQLGCTAGLKQLMDISARFYRPRKKNTLLKHVTKSELKTRALEAITDISIEARKFYESLEGSFTGGKLTFRLREPLPQGGELVKKIKDFMLLLMETEDDFDQDEFLKMEFDIARAKLFLFLENLTAVVYQNREGYVYWMEKEKNQLIGSIILRAQPIDVSEILNREVLSCHESCFFVSATLAINGDFSYIAGRLGISHYKSLYLESTFDYSRQMIAYIDRTIPQPSDAGYNTAASQIAAEIINEMMGNCLMLFTSYKTLTDIRLIIETSLRMPIYSQDRLSPSEAVAQYLDDHNSVLMGTHSFWQGIDLPGDLLRGVIMMKLPFSVPDSPPVEARIERMQESGKNPFAGYQIPEAVIRFKQGIGRLIRSKKDRGVVAILDSRILHKPYGKIFIHALPPGCPVVFSMAELRELKNRIASEEKTEEILY